MIDALQTAWKAVAGFQPELIAFVLTVFGSLIAARFRARVKLIYGRANNSYHQLKVETGTIGVYCEKLFVQNVGRKPAEKVDVILTGKPSELALYPPQVINKEEDDIGNVTLHIPYIAPKELLIIDTIHLNARAAEILSVRSPECVGRNVQFWVQRKYGLLFNISVAIMFMLGIFYLLQLLVMFGETIIGIMS